MKINPNGTVLPLENFRNKKGTVDLDSGSKSAAAGGDAFVLALSSKITQLSDSQDDEARQARVAAIKAQLAAGDYSISGKDVADKILGLLKN